MIHVAIVEDNAADANLLVDFLQKYLNREGEEYVVDRFRSGLAFLEKYQRKYDVVFMDIELPDINGLETATRLRKVDENVLLVFVTNMAQFAVDGYKVNALDFVVKPVTFQDFQLKMLRVMEQLRRNRKEVRLQVMSKNKVYFLSSADVKYIEVWQHDLIYHTQNQDLIVRGSIREVENQLSKAGFFKCNRCYLVNMKFVTSISENIVHVGDVPLQISRPRRKEFLEAMSDYLWGGE